MNSAISRTTWNLLANFLGQGWTALMGLVCFPLYVHFLGVESFGLVGFFAMLQAALAPFDLGLSTALGRELARLSVQKDTGGAMRDLARTLEIVYWCVAIFLGGVVGLLAPVLAHYWVRAETLSAATIARALGIMGLALACQWPLNLYTGGLVGLQRQVSLNALNLVLISVRYLGVLPVLWFTQPTVHVFFCWQALACLLHTLAAAGMFWRCLPGVGWARFRLERLRAIGRLAAGLSSVSIAALLFTQLDRIILSKILPLETFGYYMLASLMAVALGFLSEPVFAALYPRFAQLAVLGAEADTNALYHTGSQLVAALVLPTAMVLSLFAPEVLLLWTGDPRIADHSHLILSFLMAGTALMALSRVPYALQVAHGWTRLALGVYVVSVLGWTPVLIWAGLHYAGPGTAFGVWLMDAAFTSVTVLLMHRHLLPGEGGRWFRLDVAYPLAASVGVGVVGRWLLPLAPSRLLILLELIAVELLAVVAALASAPHMRQGLAKMIKAWRWPAQQS
jgi:O-antigen/teichoic acid export membrane protein